MMNTKFRFAFAAVCAASLAACGGTGDATRNSIKVVGSSTVYPFAKLVAENFARSHPRWSRSSSRPARAAASLVCGGVGASHPTSPTRRDA